MNIYKVTAILTCECLICRERNYCNVFPFSDEFNANDMDSALELAERKFIMIYDDVIHEFKGEGHHYEMKIYNCCKIN